MSASYKLISQVDTRETFDEREAFALDVLAGLSEAPKAIPSKYLYNKRGSELFSDITHLEEYYLTDCEIEVLELNADRLASSIGSEPFNLVELGAGMGRKAAILIKHFLKSNLEFRYVPIDISETAMKQLVSTLGKSVPDLPLNGIVSDYFNGLKWLNNRSSRKNLVLFLGSSIGNFTHRQNRFFLRNVWNSLNDDDSLLIGFDLKKDIELFLSAYNDSQGVTANFSLNLLQRINDELGGEFDLSKFRYYSTYDVFSGGMESYLVSKEKQRTYIDAIGRSFWFEPWEPIHTEYSYKYLVSDIEVLAAETGFIVEDHLFDSRKFFADSLWKVHKPGSSDKE